MPYLVEVIFVQLSHKAGEVAVLEMLWEDGLGEPLILDGVNKVCVHLVGINYSPRGLRSCRPRHPIEPPESMLDPRAFCSRYLAFSASQCREPYL